MERKTKTEIFDWFEYSDDPYNSLDRLKEFIKNCEKKGYFDIELEGSGMLISGTRYETDEEYEFRIAKIQLNEDKERKLYERLKQKFEPTD